MAGGKGVSAVAISGAENEVGGAVSVGATKPVLNEPSRASGGTCRTEVMEGSNKVHTARRRAYMWRRVLVNFSLEHEITRSSCVEVTGQVSQCIEAVRTTTTTMETSSTVLVERLHR